MGKRSSPEVLPLVRRFIEDVGNTTQSFGVGRVLGQIYAYLYFSPQPRNLGDFQDALGISKGSASVGVRQLEQWGAVRKVWVRGDRKDYYEANDWFGNILKNAILDTLGKRMAAHTELLREVETRLESSEFGEDVGDFIHARFKQLCDFNNKVQKAWDSPVVKMLLK